MSNSVLQLSDTLNRAQADSVQALFQEEKSQQTPTNTHTHTKQTNRPVKNPLSHPKAQKSKTRNQSLDEQTEAYQHRRMLFLSRSIRHLVQTAANYRGRQHLYTLLHWYQKWRLCSFPHPHNTRLVLCTYWLLHESTHLSQKPTKKLRVGGVIFYWVSKLNNLIEIDKSSSGTEQLLQLVCGPAFWLPALPDRELQGTRKIQAEEKNSVAFSYLQGRTWYLFFHLLCDFVAWYSWVFSEKSALLSETKAKKL